MIFSLEETSLLASVIETLKKTAQQARAFDEEMKQALYRLEMLLYHEKRRAKIVLVAELPLAITELETKGDANLGRIRAELERLAEPAKMMLVNPEHYGVGILLHSKYPIPEKTDLDLLIEELEDLAKVETARMNYAVIKINYGTP